jgi:hypothetical protein
MRNYKSNQNKYFNFNKNSNTIKKYHKIKYAKYNKSHYVHMNLLFNKIKYYIKHYNNYKSKI